MTVFKCWIPGCLDRGVATVVADTREQAARDHALAIPLNQWTIGDMGNSGIRFALALATFTSDDVSPVIVELELISEFLARPWPRASFAAVRLLRDDRDKWHSDDSDEGEEEAP